MLLLAPQSNHYIFDPVKLHSITKDVTSKGYNTTDEIFDDILLQLSQDPKVAATLNKHPWRDESEWLFNNAGGAMGAMYLLHASVTEVRDACVQFSRLKEI